jgi:hypothetical protein
MPQNDWQNWVEIESHVLLKHVIGKGLFYFCLFNFCGLRFVVLFAVSGDPVLGNNNPTYFKVSWLGALRNRKFRNIS